MHRRSRRPTRRLGTVLGLLGLLGLLATPTAGADLPPIPALPSIGLPAPLAPSVPAAKPKPPPLPPAPKEAGPSPSAPASPAPSAAPSAPAAKQPSVPARVPARVDRTPPGKVRALSATASDRVVTLRWNRPRDADFGHVVVSREHLGAPAATIVYRGPAGRFVDRHVRNGVAYQYIVTSYDRSGNGSGDVAAIAAPAERTLVHPSDGARVAASPVLRWVWVPGASFYNVQLFRGPSRVKVLSAWPTSNRLRLPPLAPGVYRWVVWPGFGRTLARTYGPLLGESTFFVSG